MKRYIFSLCFLIFSVYFSDAQTTYTLKGTLVDTTGQAVSGSVLVLMTRADSAQLEVEYCQNGVFELTWTDSLAREVMLYVSAIGYNGRYVEVDKSGSVLGKIVMTPLAVYMNEVTVAVQKPITHKFERGRDEYTIPEWLGQRQYNMVSLLALVPGLMRTGDEIQIAGIGKPTYLIDGQEPRPGELESLSPKDIVKVTVIRMPTAKYDKSVQGIIDIEKRKMWYDYMNSELSYNFDYSNKATHGTSVWVDLKKGKQYHFVRYNYQISPQRYTAWNSYETRIDADSIYYLMTSDQEMDKVSKVHNFSYSPEFELNDYSSLSLWYMLSAADNTEKNRIRTQFSDRSEPELWSRSLTDARIKTHLLQLSYKNTFGGSDKKQLTANIQYNRSNDDNEDSVGETYRISGQTADSIFTVNDRSVRSEALRANVDFGFTLGDAFNVETGASYNHFLSKSKMEYRTGNETTAFRLRDEYAELYLSTDQSIGKFYYQIGVRGMYQYEEKSDRSGKENNFHFLPSVGASYRVKDNLNFMLSYKRMVDYPLPTQLDPSIRYFHKYMYNTGNPSLQPTVSHSLMSRMAFPLNLALTCKYDYKKDDIAVSILPDKEDSRIITVSPSNIDKTHTLSLNLSWQRTFGFYYLSVSGSYAQFFAKSGLIDGDMYFRPRYSVNMTHYFTITPKVQATIYMQYQTAYSRYNVYQKELYAISPQLQFNLFKSRLNIDISGKNLLNSGKSYTRDKYGHTISVNESNQLNRRSISFAISYCFRTKQKMIK